MPKVPCNNVEFDNTKVFYHPTWPDNRLGDAWKTWNFYIGRPGTSASQCIDWAAEGINIEACGLDGKWGNCMGLVVTAGARVRISTYPFGHAQRTQEFVFPTKDPPVPTIYLKHM